MGLKLFFFATALTAAAQSLPDGPEKELVEVVCSSCHQAERVMTERLTRAQWEAKVLDMLQEQPDVTQPERDKIVDYLSRNFRLRIEVNKAPAQELGTALGLSDAAAAAIVRYRRENGSFKTLDDLKKVPGVDAAKLDVMREYMDFHP